MQAAQYAYDCYLIPILQYSAHLAPFTSMCQKQEVKRSFRNRHSSIAALNAESLPDSCQSITTRGAFTQRAQRFRPDVSDVL